MASPDFTIAIASNQTGAGNNAATVQINPAINVPVGTRLACVGAYVTNSFVNVSVANGNNTFSWSNGATGPITITLQDGGYDVPLINYFLQQSLAANGFSPTSSTQAYGIVLGGIGGINSVTVTIDNTSPTAGQSYSITFPANIAQMLGFPANTTVSASGVTIAPAAANLNLGITNYEITSNIAIGNYAGSGSNIYQVSNGSSLLSFTPSSGNGSRAAPGAFITIEPSFPQLANLRTYFLTSIQVAIVDNFGNAVNLNDQPWTVKLGFFYPREYTTVR